MINLSRRYSSNRTGLGTRDVTLLDSTIFLVLTATGTRTSQGRLLHALQAAQALQALQAVHRVLLDDHRRRVVAVLRAERVRVRVL